MKKRPVKAKTAAFRIVLLAFIARSSNPTGYDIGLGLKPPANLLWPGNYSQIYPVLNDMEKNDLLVSDWIEQNGKPNKKTYKLTDAGYLEFTNWLESLPTVGGLMVEEILAVSFCIGLGEIERIRQILRCHLVDLKEEIADIQERLTQSPARQSSRFQDDPGLFAILTLYRQAIGVREGQIQWIEWILSETSNNQ